MESITIGKRYLVGDKCGHFERTGTAVYIIPAHRPVTEFELKEYFEGGPYAKEHILGRIATVNRLVIKKDNGHHVVVPMTDGYFAKEVINP